MSGGDTDTNGPQVDLPPLCDGSDDVRLGFSWWVDGFSVPDGHLMLKEGLQYLRLDGRCRYIVYNGETADTARLWNPVREGTLDATQLEELVTRLRVAEWPTFTEVDLVGEQEGIGVHEEWTRFEVAGEVRRCPRNCGPRAAYARGQGILAVADLEGAARPATVDAVEVALFEAVGPPPSWTVTWESEIDPSSLVEDQIAILASGRFENVGTYLVGQEAAWFIDVANRFAARDPSGMNAQNAPGVRGPDDAVPYELYVRAVVK